MVLILWKVIGLVAGLLAGWIMPGSKPGVLLITTILGMAGASVGSSPSGAYSSGSSAGLGRQGSTCGRS